MQNAGNAITLVIGGAQESLMTVAGVTRLVLKSRKGKNCFRFLGSLSRQ
jgi:hypothetical protein